MAEIDDLRRQNAHLQAANTDLVLKNRDLRNTARVARDKFAFYGREHRTKAEGFRHSADGRFKDDPMKRENLLENAEASDGKAKTNEDLVVTIDAVLDRTSPR